MKDSTPPLNASTYQFNDRTVEIETLENAPDFPCRKVSIAIKSSDASGCSPRCECNPQCICVTKR